MSVTTSVFNGYDIRNDDGTINDREIHRYLWVTGRPVQTTELTRRFGIPRTTLWGVLQRLQNRGLVERVGIKHTGISALWRALPPDWNQLPGPEFQHLRKNAGVTQAEALAHLDARLDESPSRSAFSKFENSDYGTDLSDDARRELYQYYQQETTK